ncbi:hypothetical protein [Pseudomonas sp. TWP3-1]|uniref:hypothetical protein n=1 Tax=Pseudomonas sp. TWP3-1 TaxID=2804631 RepID=UPI003CF0D1D0
MTRLIPQSELHGQREQILDSYQAMEDFRQALNLPDDLPGFDDLLNAMGLHRSNYMQAANERKLIDAVRNGEWALVKPRVAADNGGASWNGFKPKPEPPPAQHLVEEHAYTLPQPAESGFHIVQKSMTLEALERELYEIRPGDALRREFRSLNRHLGEQVKPGQMVLFSDSRNYMCRREEAQMMAAAEKVNEALKELTDEEAAFMVEHHEVIEPFLEVSAGTLGVASFMIGHHLEGLKNTLKELEQLHQQQYTQHRHLHSPEFFAKRKRLMAKLDASLGPLVRKGTGLPDHPKLKRALGLSSRRIVHRWGKAGSSAQLPGYATNIAGVARAAKYMKGGGYLGIGLQLGASTSKIYEVCASDREAECRQVKFVEGGKMVGGTAGALAGGYIGGKVGLAVCAKLKGVGKLVCVLVVGAAGSVETGTKMTELGELVGQEIHEYSE